jgi:hypothetical protein
MLTEDLYLRYFPNYSQLPPPPPSGFFLFRALNKISYYLFPSFGYVLYVQVYSSPLLQLPQKYLVNIANFEVHSAIPFGCLWCPLS